MKHGKKKKKSKMKAMKKKISKGFSPNKGKGGGGY